MNTEQSISLPRRGGAESHLSKKDYPRDSTTVLNTLAGIFQFLCGCFVEPDLKQIEVGVFIPPCLLNKKRDGHGVVSQRIAPFLGRRVVANPHLGPFVENVLVEIFAKPQCKDLGSPEKNPMKQGWIVLVESADLVVIIFHSWNGLVGFHGRRVA